MTGTGADDGLEGLLKQLDESAGDVREGRVFDADNVGRELRARIEARKEEIREREAAPAPPM